MNYKDILKAKLYRTNVAEEKRAENAWHQTLEGKM
jgi:hypothetical protein